MNGRDEAEYGGDDEDFVRSQSDADPGSTHVRHNRSVGTVEIWPPESPGRSRSPLMFTPQVTVPLSVLMFFCNWYLLTHEFVTFFFDKLMSSSCDLILS